jgi:hypothetical protein
VHRDSGVAVPPRTCAIAASHTAEQHRIAVQEVAQSPGEGDHPLAHWHLREYVLDQVRGGRGHAPGGAGRAQAAALAREGDQEIVAAGAATGAGKATGQDPALEVGSELALDVARDQRSVGIALAPTCQPGLEVLLHQPVESGALGTAAAIDPRRAGTGRGCEMRRDGRHPCPATAGGSAEGNHPRAARLLDNRG